MKFFLISAALVAVAVAVPVLVQPGGMGPAPVDFDQSNPISVGPAIVEPQVKPSLIQIVINVDSQGRVDMENPIDVGPVIVDQVPDISVAPQPSPVIMPEPEFPSPQPSPVIMPEPEFPLPQPSPVIMPEPVFPAPQPSPVIQEAEQLN